MSTLTAKCRAAGLKVSGKKNELVARLALWHGLRIFDGPRTRRHRDRVAAVAEPFRGTEREDVVTTVHEAERQLLMAIRALRRAIKTLD